MIFQRAITGVTRRRRSVPIALDGRDWPSKPGATPALFIGVLTVLLATGWAANHFSALIPAIDDRIHLGRATLDAIFGIYAAGLLPGLLIGGRASDTFGRRSVVWAGSVTTLIGTVAMLVSLQSTVLLAGRLVVGVGVGLAISSCTAWASDLKGPAGAAVAGAVLTTGFGIGPFAAGFITGAGQPGIRTSFGIAAVMVAVTTIVVSVIARHAAVVRPAAARDPERLTAAGQGSVWALSWAMPLAPWVFSSTALAFVTIPARVHVGFASAAIVAGTAALITYGVSTLAQLVTATHGWRRPQTGSIGALMAGLGFAGAAAAPQSMTLGMSLPLLVALGCASGLLLREGLIDLEAAAPEHVRGALTGIFYAVTCTGLGLPFLLSTVGSAEDRTILGVMAVLASATAVSRAVRLRRDSYRFGCRVKHRGNHVDASAVPAYAAS